jgi:hypothetical protein
MNTAYASGPGGELVTGGRLAYRPGDLVTSQGGYPVLYEVLGLEREGVLRVRGNNWAPGYTALVSLSEVRPAAQILGR